MKYSQFRSKCVRELWKIHSMEHVVFQQSFSTWRIDDICANHWRANQTDTAGCIKELDYYVRAEVLLRW